MITIWPTNRTTTRSHTHTHTCTICAVTCWPAAAWPIKLARLYKTKPTAGTCDIRAVLSFGKIRKGKKKRPKKAKKNIEILHSFQLSVDLRELSDFPNFPASAMRVRYVRATVSSACIPICGSWGVASDFNQ